METRFTILLWEVGVALALQIGILLAILLAVKKSMGRLEALADEVQKRAMPTLDAVQGLVESTRPKMEDIVGNLSASATILRQQMERLDSTVNDIVDRTRLQVIRADELVSRTMDRVEETTEAVHHTVLSPVRQLTALLRGLSAGVNVLFGNRRPSQDRVGAPQDEMFI